MIATINPLRPQTVYRPQTLSATHEKPSPQFTTFVLPRRLGPFIFLLVACGICVMAMFAVNPGLPVVTAPTLPPTKPYVAPVITVPEAPPPSEIEEVATLLPQAAAATLPIAATKRHGKPMQHVETAVHSHITVSDPAPMPQEKAQQLMRKAVTTARAGQPGKALTIMQQALQVDPDNTGILYNLAVLHDHMGNTAQAEDYYRQVMGNPTPGQGIDYRRVAARISQLRAINIPPEDLAETDPE